MGEPNLHQLVFQAAQEILAEGKYPTINLICERLGLNRQEISDVLDIQPSSHNETEAIPASQVEILEALTLMNRLRKNTQQSDNQEESGFDFDFDENQLLENAQNPDYVAQMVQRVDQKAQYMAAAEVVLTQQLYRHYRNTQKFSQPEIKKQVENALQETEADWEGDIQNFSPAAILKKYGKSNP